MYVRLPFLFSCCRVSSFQFCHLVNLFLDLFGPPILHFSRVIRLILVRRWEVRAMGEVIGRTWCDGGCWCDKQEQRKNYIFFGIRSIRCWLTIPRKPFSILRIVLQLCWIDMMQLYLQVLTRIQKKTMYRIDYDVSNLTDFFIIGFCHDTYHRTA